MKTFLQPLQNLAEMEQIREQAKDNRGVLAVSGCMESQKAHMLSLIHISEPTRP